MRREASADARVGGVPAKLAADRRSRPGLPAGGAVDDAERRAEREEQALGEPGPQVFPAPSVHADLGSALALAAANEHRAAPLVKITFGERERLLDAKPAAPEHHVIARSLKP